jgi:hypothetical protein
MAWMVSPVDVPHVLAVGATYSRRASGQSRNSDERENPISPAAIASQPAARNATSIQRVRGAMVAATAKITSEPPLRKGAYYARRMKPRR